MSPSRVLFSSVSAHWATPQSLYQELNEEFLFTLDPCPLKPKRDGLALSWRGERVFCNPPYGHGIAHWLMKAREPEVAVYLLPARTDTEWFHEYVLLAEEIRFLRGRLRFNELAGDNRGGRAPFPTMLVIYRPLASAPPPVDDGPREG